MAVLLAGFFYLKFGLKKALFMSYSISAVGSLLIIAFETTFTDLMPVFVLLSKFGLGSAFGLIYLSNFIFPTKYASQTLGFCNTSARFFTMLSPVLVE